MENNLPQGWDSCDIKTICSITTGRRDVNEGNPEGRYPFFTCAQEEYKIDTYEFEGESILIAGNGFFNVKYFNGKFNAYQRTYVLQNFDIISKYLYYCISSKLSDITKDNRGSTIRYIRLGDLADYEIPIAPLPEQHRIVAKLDTLMEKLESNKQRLDKIPKLLKRFRQSILAAAVSGKLTEDWRVNNRDLESAEELLKRLNYERPNGKNRKLAEIENTNESELPDTWKWCQLDEIALLVTDGKHGDCNDEINSGYYFLSAKDVSNGVLNYKNTRQIVYEEFLETHRRTNLEDGDICVVNTGATVGKSAIAQNNELTPKTTFQKSVAVIKLFKESIDSKYIDYIIQLETPKILKKSGGSAINNWLLSEMRAFWCQLPPTKEQKEIVRRVEQLFAFADKIEARYTKAKVMLDKLPQSILAKAFRGELVPQDPNDEPASVLLERIRAEKEKLAKEKKYKKSKLLKK